MHTPDGFITTWVCVLMLLLSALPVVLASRNLKRSLTKEKALNLCLVAVVVFMAQLLNFPIDGGTSGHLIGGAFALLVLGVDGAVVALSMVILVQALLFGDGGVLSLGANIFNMAVVGVYAADFAYKRLPISGNARTFSIALISVVAAAAACAVELAASGTAPFLDVFNAMTMTHMMMGIGEGILTLALAGIFASRLESLTMRGALVTSGVSFLALALALPFASNAPDGLESVSLELGFFGNSVQAYNAPLQDYSMALFGGMPYMAGLIAILAGSALLFSLPLMIRPTSLPS